MIHSRGSQKFDWCYHCSRRTLHEKQTLSQWHLFFLVVTCGLYTPMFMIVWLLGGDEFLCQRCGTPN